MIKSQRPHSASLGGTRRCLWCWSELRWQQFSQTDNCVWWLICWQCVWSSGRHGSVLSEWVHLFERALHKWLVLTPTHPGPERADPCAIEVHLVVIYTNWNVPNQCGDVKAMGLFWDQHRTHIWSWRSFTAGESREARFTLMREKPERRIFTQQVEERTASLSYAVCSAGTHLASINPIPSSLAFVSLRKRHEECDECVWPRAFRAVRERRAALQRSDSCYAHLVAFVSFFTLQKTQTPVSPWISAASLKVLFCICAFWSYLLSYDTTVSLETETDITSEQSEDDVCLGVSDHELS